ncbi:hypothetical protein MRX96_038903 [Rhipicephalus microplus]
MLFTNRKNVLRHVRDVHKVAPEVNTRVKCDVCAVGLSSLEEYVRHHIATHEFVAEYVQHTFLNDKEFSEWKAQEEANKNCWFVRSTAPKKLASGQTRIHYYCNRSGVARPKEGHGKRREKSQGTCRFVCKHIHCVVIANTP